jgi:nanoRNase/pAp phosphatase (c-di-AMP/oligoRNAs hydrolase)
MKKIRELIDYLKDKGTVYIQTHNFPDHDAIAAAFGLQYVFEKFGIQSRITYEGSIQRGSLWNLIRRVYIDVIEASKLEMSEEDIIVIVDGCKGNKNVTDLAGREVAVIDHHDVESPDDVLFVDIRQRYGSCSTIIFEYFRELDIPLTADISTALLTGLDVDTSLMTRGVEQEDLEAWASLYIKADTAFVNSNLKNSIQVKELAFFRKALDNVRIHDRILFCYFANGCNQNLMGILGDFFLTLIEIDFVVLCARNEAVINFSVRSERKEWNAANIIQKLLVGIGFGGGHAEMSGGIIKDTDAFDEDSFFTKLTDLLRS